VPKILEKNIFCGLGELSYCMDVKAIFSTVNEEQTSERNEKSG